MFPIRWRRCSSRKTGLHPDQTTPKGSKPCGAHYYLPSKLLLELE